VLTTTDVFPCWLGDLCVFGLRLGCAFHHASDAHTMPPPEDDACPTPPPQDNMHTCLCPRTTCAPCAQERHTPHAPRTTCTPPACLRPSPCQHDWQCTGRQQNGQAAAQRRCRAIPSRATIHWIHGGSSECSSDCAVAGQWRSGGAVAVAGRVSGSMGGRLASCKQVLACGRVVPWQHGVCAMCTGTR
jgi:hypothetical protein